ncbi:nuclear pore complex protein Nup98-Nup96-like [Bradysia coprophila]|uniref:nuclear pore complex protein Nup98-Nup96-like n=1 Tax=Bradysia coprophila TaxID=38358 RepID=UPI00187DCC07|nr:nuclear pore complex protein Nup98-Nup96-like [Bradysia coprophila]
MVICKYFLKNSCSFGPQCKNEHINVATVVKTDAEASIKGKQWMLSSYGPFKDKPSLPNFEDQSFEEIRSLCYEAKNNGNLQALLPQLSQQAADASYKISMLCDQNHVNNNLLNMLVNLYDTGESTANTQSNLGTGNPFAVSSAVGGGQTPSLFGTNTTQQQNPFGGSLFGNNKAPPPSGIFGSANTSSSTTGNFFGQQSTFGSGGQSAFGGQTAFGGQGAFGGTTTAANNTFGTSSFGQTAASPFSLSQIGQPAEAPKPTSSIFGASAFQQTQNSVFGAAPAFSNPIQPTKPSGLFGTGSMFGQAATPSGLFGQSNQPANQPVNSGNLFSSFGASAQPQTQSQGLFGAANENKSIFGQSTNSNQSVFGANQQQINQNTSSNQSPFGANPQQANQSSNIFANALQQQGNTQNVFGVPQEQQPSIFGQSNTAAPNIFQNQSNASTGSNIFQNQSNVPAVGSVFGGSVFGQQAVEQVNHSAYSKMEDLEPEDLQWFNAPNFVLGAIPTIPPPKELCAR